MDIKTKINELNFKDISFNVFISECNMENLTKPKTSMAFLNLLILEFHTEISYYRTKILQSGLIINVKDSFLYSAQLFYNNMWTFSHFTYDIKEINNFNTNIRDNLLPVGQKLFQIYESTCPQHINYMKYILSNDEDSVLIGTLDSFLLSTNLLKELLSITKDISSDIKNYWIKKHKINEKRILKGERFRHIIFKEAFKKLAKKGRIRLIGEEIVIPIELRLKVLECIKSKLSEFPNIKVKIIDDYIINGMKI